MVVHFGAETDVLIRLQGQQAVAVGPRLCFLQEEGEQVELRRVDFVGPQIGEELRDDGGLGMLTALAIVMLYVAIRFQFKFSVGAVLALARDVIITLGVFSLARLEFDLPSWPRCWLWWVIRLTIPLWCLTGFAKIFAKFARPQRLKCRESLSRPGAPSIPR